MKLDVGWWEGIAYLVSQSTLESQWYLMSQKFSILDFVMQQHLFSYLTSREATSGQNLHHQIALKLT